MSRIAWAILAVLIVASGCRTGDRETFVTYFNGEQRVSLIYPSEWRTDEAEQEGVWYRYFLAPPTAPDTKAAMSVTLLAGPLASSIEEYAESYLAGNAGKVVSRSGPHSSG